MAYLALQLVGIRVWYWYYLCCVFNNLQIVCERSHVYPSACAIARALPMYSRKSSILNKRRVTVEFVLTGPGSDQPLTGADLQTLSDIAQGIRLAAKITDMPCQEMHTDAFVQVVKCSIL